MSKKRGSDVEAAARMVRAGRVVAYPTDTVYGLGALALRREAVQRVFELKGRDPAAPLSVAVAGWEMAARVADVAACGPLAARLAALLPGPFTVLLPPRPGLPVPLVGPTGRVGLRIPDHPMALGLARACGPITATSANPSGAPAPRSADDVRLPVDYLLDGGPCPVGEESTVFDPLGGHVVRRGARWREVEAWLREAHD